MYGREIALMKRQSLTPDRHSPDKENHWSPEEDPALQTSTEVEEETKSPTRSVTSAADIAKRDRASPGSSRTTPARESPPRGSPSKDKPLMTRKQLLNPFDSDEDEEGGGGDAGRDGSPSSPGTPSSTSASRPEHLPPQDSPTDSHKSR